MRYCPRVVSHIMASIIDLIGAFTYGLSSSLTLCLPVYLPILAGYGDDVKKGVRLSIGFALGRFSGYFTLGILAALMGGAFLGFFENTYPGISSKIVAVFGLTTVLMGVLMLSKTKIGFFGEKRCQTYMGKMERINNPFLGSGFLGFISTITPCVPVFTFLLLPFALGKVWETAFITIAFGFGANIVFIVIAVAMALGVKNVHERFQTAKKGMELTSALALIVFGTFYMIWAVGPALFGWANNNYALPTAFDFMDFVKYLFGVA